MARMYLITSVNLADTQLLLIPNRRPKTYASFS